MATIWRKSYHKIIGIFLRIVRFLWYIFLYIFHKGSGKTVPPIKDLILLKSGTTLAAEIRTGKSKSEEIVNAYIKRIKEVEPFINATADQRFDEALVEARQADELVASGKFTKKQLETEKPLLGVPVTIKVLISVKDMRTTAGSLLFENLKAAEDADVVALLKKAGAIVLATTNSPEFGLNCETNNYVHGKTSNPYDTSKTSGGSSGGESALISAAGSVIGIGNDLAGSIRQPCMYTGIYGHKPSRDLVSNRGCFPVPPPKIERFLSTGPMCRYAVDLVTSMNILTSQNQSKMKFGQPVNFKKLNIYYMLSLGGDPTVPEVDRDQVEALKSALSHFETTYGIKAKETKIPLLKRSIGIYTHNVLRYMDEVRPMITGGKANVNFLEELLKYLFGRTKLTFILIFMMCLDLFPTFYNPDKVPLFKKLAEELEEEFDALLDENSVFFYPTFPQTAPFHYSSPFLLSGTAYTMIFNLLGLPVTQCTMGRGRNGLPVGIQIVGRKNNDPLTVACAVELENAFGGWIPPCEVEIEK